MCPFSSTTYGSCLSIVRWKYKFTSTQLNMSSCVLKLQMTSQYLRKYRKQIGQDEQNKTDSEIIRMEIYSINEMHHEVPLSQSLFSSFVFYFCFSFACSVILYIRIIHFLQISWGNICSMFFWMKYSANIQYNTASKGKAKIKNKWRKQRLRQCVPSAPLHMAPVRLLYVTHINGLHLCNCVYSCLIDYRHMLLLKSFCGLGLHDASH
jgi:hypothetical protein